MGLLLAAFISRKYEYRLRVRIACVWGHRGCERRETDYRFLNQVPYFETLQAFPLGRAEVCGASSLGGISDRERIPVRAKVSARSFGGG